MSELPTTSFLIFHDPHAPYLVETLDPKEVAQLEADHEKSKIDDIEQLKAQFLQMEREKMLSKEDQEALYNARHAKADLTDPVSEWGPWGELRNVSISSVPHDLEPETPESPAEVEALQIKIDALERQARQYALDPAIESRLDEVVQAVQALSADEDDAQKYIRYTFPRDDEAYWRNYALLVHKIVSAKFELPDFRYSPSLSPDRFVLIRRDGTLGINMADELKAQPLLKFEVVDGWSADERWGGYLRVSSSTEKGKYLYTRDTLDEGAFFKNYSLDNDDSGWVELTSSEGAKITFCKVGNHYEIWQSLKSEIFGPTTRWLTVVDGRLKFVMEGSSAKWNIVSTDVD
ncbi:hypothetical protein [Pseudomonas putida]|uniref:hypothetical protein n=1 Tax=Pseudomonas putida TaxID=303 RepID=UPI0039067263